MQVRAKFKELTKQHKCQPWRAQVPLLGQIPLWISMIIGYILFSFSNVNQELIFLRITKGLRHVTSAEYLAANPDVAQLLLHGGALWFSDLTAPDTTWILPVALGLTNLLNIEVCLCLTE